VIDTSPQGVFWTYVERVAAGDLDGATRMCMDLVDAGYPVGTVLSEVLAPAQAEVGAKWERAELNVAQEHAATSVTDAALAALARTLPEPSPVSPLLMVCGEGEWHSLPARMGAVLLQSRGWPVRFVGASPPLADLSSDVNLVDPLAVLVSATMASLLPGVARTTAAVHGCGVPVLAGGSAFGSQGQRAPATGADAWAPDVASADHQLETWRRDGPPALYPSDHTPPGAAAYEQLCQRHHVAVETALADSGRRLGDPDPEQRSASQAEPATYDKRPVGHIRADLSNILDFLEAAVLVDDLTVLTDMLASLAYALAHRGVPTEVLSWDLGVLAAALDDLPAARDRLLWAAEQQQA